MKISVQDVPKTKSSNSNETDRVGAVGGIVRRAGECRPIRKSGGTQYSKPFSESLTQPFSSGCAQKSAWMRLEKEESRMVECMSQTWIVVSQDPETMCCPSGEQEMDPTFLLCAFRGFPTASPVLASQIRSVVSADEDMMYCPLGE